MSSLSRELVFLILQFLDEEKFKETVHKLEQESAFYFNMKYFEEQVQAGEWDEVERYLCGFTKVEDNRYSMKIFFELRKQKYLEALDRNDRAKAVEILVKDLKIFSTFNEELFKEITQLLTLDNFRQNEQLSKYGDTKSARSIMLVELKKLIEANPLFREKLTLPVFKASRLRTLINQSLNWQHQLCKNPRPNPDIKTLFIDHTCASTNGGRAPPPNHNSLAGPIPKAGVFPPIGAHGPFQPVVSPSAGAIAGWMATNNPSMPHGAIAAGPPGIVQPPVAAAFLKHPRTPPGGPGFEYQMAESEHSMKRARVGPSDEVSFSGSTHLSNMYSPDDLPKTVVRNLNQGSNVMCMDFHPQQQTMLLVGTNVGDISIWEVGSREKVVHKPFKVWDISALSMPFQTTLVKDAAISVTRCIWGPDGSILGVAFSKHIIQIYTYNPSGELRQHLEIDAHVGGVNDIAFAHPNKQLCIVTCGDDKTIKVWDAVAGRRQYTFEGHEAPVYSVCPHYKEQIQFIFSTAIDGKIKAWLYDCLGSRVDYDAPGRSCTTMAYSADGIRLFSCGTSKEGEAHLVEWNESEGAIKREYSGFRKRSMGVVQFDTTRNRFLAAGDEFQIKFWDMDSTNLLTVTDADDGLPVRPKLRFNKEGSLLAVTTSDNGFKILANGDGQRMLRMLESRAYEGSRAFSDTVKPSIAGPLGPIPNASSSMASAMERERMQTPLSIGSLANAESSKVVDIKPRIVDNADKTKSWKLHEIVDCSHLKALKLPDPVASSKVMRLIYTNSGLALLALASSAVHKLWKWQKNDRNPSGKSTASVVPQLWQPANGALMSNDVNESKPAEESAACIALSKNDSYVMSASGGKVSLFNMMTFKVMTTFMPPPPAATYLAFHPQDNNIVAIGMEDSTIHIYNVRIDEVKMKLKGHQKQITGLAFSQTLNSLVSAGADAQLCIWNINGWEKRKSRTIQSPPGYPSSLAGETEVQFHNDQRHLLVVHESQIAIYDHQLECLKLWSPRESLSAGISSAIYSCDGLLLFTGFSDGAVGVFDAESLRLRCRIAPSAYISSSISSNSTAYPTVIAAHPSDRNQFALGMSDGSVHVIEPTDADLKPRIVDNADKSKSWKLHEIVDCSHLKALELPDPVASSKIKVESLEHSDIVDSFDHLEVCKHDVEEMDSEEETDYEDNDDAEEMDSEEETDYEDNDDAEETSDEEEIDHNSKEPDSEEDQTDELDLVGEASSLTTADIVNSSHLKALRLPDPMATTKVMRIIYTNSGLALLALTSSAVHKLWKWKRTSGKSTASVVPQLWQPSNGALMSNDVDESKPAQESAACIVLSKNDSYVMSASGGKVSLFNIMTFKVMTTFMRPPPAVTYLALHPQDNNIIAIGMEDSSIHIYNVRFDEVKSKLINGHQKQITGLDFSQTVSSLVSAGADAQLCIWNTNGWEKRKSRTIQSPPGYPSSLAGETKVQFHIDQRHLLVVHESQIAIYDYQLECLKLWSPRESLSAGISSAIYSCNGLLLFTAFLDGAVGVFDAQNLRLRCRIAPSVYIFYSSNSTAYPTVIAAHPSDPNQFALGMSDGSVHVIEPIDADLKWGGLGAQDNSTLASSNPSNSALNSQPSETPSR